MPPRRRAGRLTVIDFGHTGVHINRGDDQLDIWFGIIMACRALLQRARASSVALHGPAQVRLGAPERGYVETAALDLISTSVPCENVQARCISSTSRGESPSGGPANPGAQTVEKPFTSIPPASWSLHDLQLLQEDRAKGDTHAISKEEVGTPPSSLPLVDTRISRLPLPPPCSWASWRRTRTWT